MRARGANAVYLPDVRFPPNLSVNDDLGATLAGAELIVSAIPSHGTRDILRRAVPHIRRGSTIVSGTKGLEQDTLLRVSEIIAQEMGDAVNVAVLSGPSFAAELARELPTAVSIASRDADVVQRVQAEFRSPYFRLYGTDDVVGVEIGGALKNVIAIAAGMVEGLGLGHNALAGLITRGLAEMSRLACAAGAKRETLAGLTGLGDLVLTCTGALSRNRHVGIELASGRAVAGRAGWNENGGRGRANDGSRARARGAIQRGTSDCGPGRRVARGSKGPTDGARRADVEAAARGSGVIRLGVDSWDS